MMEKKKIKNMVLCHGVKDVFQEEWDQHGQMLGNKVKVRMKN